MHGDGVGSSGGCGRGCGCGASRFFCLFQAWLFGEYGGCESGDRSYGWGGGVGVVEVVSSKGMGVGVCGADNRGDSMISSGGNASVGGGGARWRDCGRFPDGIFGEF